MNERYAQLLNTIQIRDNLTLGILALAFILMAGIWLLHHSSFTPWVKSRLIRLYAAICIMAWALCMLILTLTPGLQ